MEKQMGNHKEHEMDFLLIVIFPSVHIYLYAYMLHALIHRERERERERESSSEKKKKKREREREIYIYMHIVLQTCLHEYSHRDRLRNQMYTYIDI